MLLVISGALVLPGCAASTRFIPPKDGRAYLALVKGEPAVIRNGAIVPISRGVGELLSSDPVTQDFSRRASSTYRAAVSKQTAALLVVSCLPITFPIATPVTIEGGNQLRASIALLVDSVNSHNDRVQREGKP